YGSVSTRDLAELLTQGGFTVNRNQIQLNAPIKMIGVHNVPVALHPELEVGIKVYVARNADEAERLARGRDGPRRPEQMEEEESPEAAAEAFFEKPAESEEEPQPEATP